MNKLQTIENHLVANNKEQVTTAPSYQHYKNMSNLDARFIKKLIYNAFDIEKLDQFENIFRNKKIFTPQTELEETRGQKRENGNTKLLSIYKEISKIAPISDVFNDLPLYTSLALPIYFYDESLSTKYTVNFQLYHKTIVNLGTEQHESFRINCEQAKDFGSFALTELGHGSNVRGILTTATYDKDSQEFIINTPNEKAMKFWIGGVAKTANMTTIFAQLYLDGKCYGPHAFIVPLRDKSTHQPFPGLILGDCGKKAGLDGIDNGFIIFNNYRIPRTNLLNRLSNVTPDGKFEAKIENPDQRFALSLGALSNGRLLIGSSNSSGIQYGLKIALRYSAMRTQFGKPNQEESPILEYPMQQFRLFPYLASSVSIQLGISKLVKLWAQNQSNLFVPGNQTLAELHALISVMKPYISWTCNQGLQECRQACGGLGYSYYSKISILMNDMDVNQTWEGDNNVLIQQTSKFLLDMLKNKMKGKVQKETIACEWIKLTPVLGDKSIIETEEQLTQPSALLEILEFRGNLLLQKTGLEISSKLQDKGDPIDVWNEMQVFGAKDLALAFGDIFLVQQFKMSLEGIRQNYPNEDTKECLEILLKLDALMRINSGLLTYVETEYFNSHHVTLVRNTIKRCVKDLKRHAIALTYAFYPSEDLVDSMLAPRDGELYKSITNRVFTAPDAFTRINNWKEIYSIN